MGNHLAMLRSAISQEGVTEKNEEDILSDFHSEDLQCAPVTDVSSFNNEFVTQTSSVLNFKNLFKPEYVDLTLEELQEKALHIELRISLKECQYVEEQTKNQSYCNLWYEYRAGRITASNLGSVCKVRSFTSNKSLILKIVYPYKKSFKSEAMTWGLSHEKEALESYSEIARFNHTNFKIVNSGLIINPKHPFLAASPDGIVECDCCGKGLVEIKCPFSAKEMLISDARLAYLVRDHEGRIRLDNAHAYYYQVNCQMFLMEVEYCDFVVWTTKGPPHIERIFIDNDFCQKFLFKACEFFHKAILPELLGHCFTREVENKSSFSSHDADV